MRRLLQLLLLATLAWQPARAAEPQAATTAPLSVDTAMAALRDFYPAYRAIQEAEPATYRRMRGIVEAALADGADMRDIAVRMRAEIKELYLRRLPTAPDALLLEYAGFMAAAMVYFEQHDVRACSALLTGGAGGSYGPELNRRDSDILTRVLLAPAVQRPFATQEEAARASDLAVQAAARTLHKPAEQVLAAIAGQASPEEGCAASRAFVGEIRRIGTTEPAVLRTLLFK
jgi:hypothetical protein